MTTRVCVALARIHECDVRAPGLRTATGTVACHLNSLPDLHQARWRDHDRREPPPGTHLKSQGSYEEPRHRQEPDPKKHVFRSPWYPPRVLSLAQSEATYETYNAASKTRPNRRPVTSERSPYDTHQGRNNDHWPGIRRDSAQNREPEAGNVFRRTRFYPVQRPFHVSPCQPGG